MKDWQETRALSSSGVPCDSRVGTVQRGGQAPEGAGPAGAPHIPAVAAEVPLFRLGEEQAALLGLLWSCRPLTLRNG